MIYKQWSNSNCVSVKLNEPNTSNFSTKENKQWRRSHPESVGQIQQLISWPSLRDDITAAGV